MEYIQQRWIAMKRKGQQGIPIDMLLHTMKERRQQLNTIERWIAMDRNRQHWKYYHTQWIRDDSNGALLTKMYSDGQKWVAMDTA